MSAPKAVRSWVCKHGYWWGYHPAPNGHNEPCPDDEEIEA